MAEEMFEHVSNLENLLSPFCYETETPLPKTSPEVPGGIYISGFISQDCAWGCCFNQSVIKCFPVDRYFEDQSGCSTSSCSSLVAVSSSSYNFSGGRITCAAELAIHNQRTSSGARKLLLGISYAGENKDFHGALVIFDPIRCAPMKWIELPDPVSSVTVLSHFEEGGSNRPFFNETMMAMVGIAAVGLRGGTVIIVDLGLDNLNCASSCDMRNISNLSYRLLYVNPHEYVIATKRHNAVSKRSLISLKFANEPEDEMVPDAFYYCKPNGESILVLQKNSVAVTCIEYVPAIGSLLVGYTCGAFQIWRVNNMELQFSSDPIHAERNVPVFGFCFQQPVDDPKNYCYVWVMYGTNSAEYTYTFVELHSLLFDRKNYIENFGYTYDGFRQCARRVTLSLTDIFNSDEGSQDAARPVRIWAQPDSDLMFCAWEVGRGGLFYVGAFDLNQWYSNHTKECIVYHPVTGLCPYWVALPVEIADLSSVLLDVRIIPKSLLRWENPHSKQDMHLYPASLSFRAVCVTNKGISAFEHFGVQEKLIRIMLKDGPNLMIQPNNFKNSFMRYGLEPIFQLTYGDQLSQKDRDRYFLFSVLLESRRTSAIMSLASIWLDGSYANVGCTVDLIIDWIGSYMMAVRHSADEHWENLLNFPDDSLPPETIRFINFSNFAWTSLHRILLTLMNPAEVYSTRGIELEDIEFGLAKLVQYSSALLMLHKAKLLPESDQSFLRNLTEYYEQRRVEARRSVESSSYIDPQYKKSHPLMIDHLMDGLLVDEDLYELWHVEEGQPLYPPQHIGYLANMFMWTDVDPKAVSRVFMYFLIDLNSFFAQYASGSSNSDAERKIRGNFRAVMDAAAEEYHDIMNLWLLDHGFHDEILVHLKEKDRLQENDGLPWCAATVVLTAVGYEIDVSELLMNSCPSSLAKLLFNLMTSSNSGYTSLAELIVSDKLTVDDELLQQFFEISDNRNFLGEFIQRKAKELRANVQNALLDFLNKSNSFKRLSQLLMYYVYLEDYQKLEQEFERVRNVLHLKSLPESEKRIWKFQENYIVHLLSTTSKKSIVENFLRLQAPPPTKQIQCTINLPVAAAKLDESSPSSSGFRRETKLPPQLRKLKLSETIMSDPLSPLKRYAGRIKNAVLEKEPDNGIADLRKSRRFSIRNVRTSLPMSTSNRRMTSRLSIAPAVSVNLNDSRGMMNDLTGNSSFNIDLVSILKPPSIDHRLEKSRGASFVANMTLSGLPGMDETITQAQPVHSIMKEKDSARPKSMKKVELRFENISLHSSTSDDEKDVTVYEDADENVQSDSGAENDIAIASFEASFTSEIENSETETRDVSQPVPSGMELETRASSVRPITPIREFSEPVDSEIEGSPPVKRKHTRASSSRSTTPTKELPETVESEIEKEVPFLTTRQTRASSARPITPTREFSEPVESEMEGSPPVERKHTRASSSRSTTPTKELPETVESEIEEEIPFITTRQTRASSARPITPTREFSGPVDSEIEGSPPVEREHTRASSSRSTTPTRQLSEIAPSEIEKEVPFITTRQTRASSGRPITPTREFLEPVDSEIEGSPPVKRKHTRASSRSTTPTRELPETVHSEMEEEIPFITTRQTRASSARSTTPTREFSGPVDSKVEGLPPAKRKHTRASSSRSTTPTREVSEMAHSGTEKEGLKVVKTKRSRASSRSTTPSRELPETVESEIEEEIPFITTRQTRASSVRPITPTREFSEPVDSEIEGSPPVKRKHTRASSSRSTTPTRQLSETAHSGMEEEISFITTRQTRASSARSTTPTREFSEPVHLGIELESSPPVKRKHARASSSRSTTPTREVSETAHSGAEKEGLKVVKTKRTRASSRSTTPTRELSEAVQSEIEEEIPFITTRQTRASLARSTTPTREFSEPVDSEIEGSPPVKRKHTRASSRSTTPTRELSETAHSGMEEEISFITTRQTRASSARSTTPTREFSEPVHSETVTSATKRKKSRASSSRSTTPTRESSETVHPESKKKEAPVDDKQGDDIPSTSSKKPVKKPKRPVKRRLKYFRHQQELSTVIEDSLQTDVSVFDTTVLPQQVEPPSQPKKRRIKGIKQNSVIGEEEASTSAASADTEAESPKSTKRRKQAAVQIEDLDDEDIQSEVGSHVSLRSNRSSASSKKSTTSDKGRGKGRRGRGKK